MNSGWNLLNPQPVDGAVVVVVALAGAAINTIAALAVRERDADLNTRAAELHVASDAGVSVGVAASGAIIVVAGGRTGPGPAVSLAIGLIIGAQGVRLLKQSSRVLLEQAPEGIDIDQLSRQVTEVPGVTRLHDIHEQSVSGSLHLTSAHLEVTGHPSLEEARQVAGRVNRLLAERFAISHATLECECEPCAPSPERDVTEPGHTTPPAAYRH